jgi:hypothetical protein
MVRYIILENTLFFNINTLVNYMQPSIITVPAKKESTLSERQIKALVNNRILLPKSAIIITDRDPQSTTSKFVKTDDISVIESLNARGWVIEEYKEQKRQKRNQHRVGFQKYRATYHHKSNSFDLEEEGNLTIVQTGAHDGTTKQTLQLGFLRQASLHNVIAGGIFKWSMKHYSNQPEYLPAVMQELVEHLPLLKLQINKMYSKILTTAEVKKFAEKAIAFRFLNKVVDIKDVLKVHREADEGNRLWKVYNRVHENLLLPNYEVGTVKNNETRYRKPKTPTGINFVIDFNVNIWNLAQDVLK